MKPPPFAYHDPREVGEAVALLSELDNAKVFAGGQSLMPLLNFRLARPDDVVDINRIGELSAIDWDQAGVVRIGATVRQRAAEQDVTLAARFPLLVEAIGHIGHFQTRNRGTVGGSIAHLDPAAELACVASAADAIVHLRSARGERAVPFADYPLGLLTPDIEPDELLVHVDFPLWPRNHGHAFVEFARRHGDFAIVAVAALLALDADERVTRARIAVTGLGPVPIRASGVEAALLGEIPAPATLDKAAAEVAALPVSGDDRAPAEYRRHLAGYLTRTALRTATARATSDNGGQAR